jgi:hypothetical protein
MLHACVARFDVTENLDSKDSSCKLQVNYITSYIFYLYLIFYVCATRFDVTKKFWKFLRKQCRRWEEPAEMAFRSASPSRWPVRRTVVQSSAPEAQHIMCGCIWATKEAARPFLNSFSWGLSCITIVLVLVYTVLARFFVSFSRLSPRVVGEKLFKKKSFRLRQREHHDVHFKSN